ncbi:MAG: nucleotidyltransferase [Clostridia bacterium]|nr:nucleotidyltransferase [Clostridia bacterium]
MAAVGIIAEYNPLHSGHAYHMEKARELTCSEAVVCVLSSHFVQIGEPSVVSKWARTKMALKSGADLVLELPSALSCASAEYFASAGIRLLSALGVVDSVCFGSEEGNIGPLEEAAELLAFESTEFKALLKQGLDQGLSFPIARQKAVEKLLTTAKGSSAAQNALDKPNNILGIEYIKAIKRFGSSLKPITLERKGQGYNSLKEASEFSSASAIRKFLRKYSVGLNSPSSLPEAAFIRSNMPQSSIDVLAEECTAGRGPVYLEAFESLLFYLMRTLPESALAQLPYMGEGLENRLKKAALNNTCVEGLVSSVVSSRYPASRVRRILCSLLMGLQADFLEELRGVGYVPYIRVLGFSPKGQHLLSKMRKTAELPLIIKPANYQKLLGSTGQKLFELEARVTDIYSLASTPSGIPKGGLEFRSSPILYRSDAL